MPSLFPWVEINQNIIQHIDKTENSNNIEKDSPNTSEQEYSLLNNTDNTKEENSYLTFNELKCNDKLYIPMGWTKNILPLNNAPVIIFNKMICKTIETESQLIVLKEIWITQDMKIQIKALGKQINLNVFGINSEILTSLNVLEDLIKNVETFNICEAYKDIYEAEYTSIAIRESNNTLRHKKCTIILKNETQCNFCKNISYILDKKRKRLNDSDVKPVKRIRIDNLSPRKKKIIDDIRKRKHAITQYNIRNVSTIKELREKMEEMQKKINSRDEQMLEDAMAGKNVPMNQQQALKEILSASSRKNVKSRRYSDKWILLCLLFHMKSPKGYHFILDNKILPLPSPSTIRRYNLNKYIVYKYIYFFSQKYLNFNVCF